MKKQPDTKILDKTKPHGWYMGKRRITTIETTTITIITVVFIFH